MLEHRKKYSFTQDKFKPEAKASYAYSVSFKTK
jgi:hypothetical protein